MEMQRVDNQQRPFDGLRELALFAGAGGGILGGHLLGWRTICAVEWAAYPAAVLAARQDDGLLPPFPIWSDVQTFDGKPWRGRVDVVSGGFPCQDISAAGKGAGIDGERSGMWSHMARIIGEVQPVFVFVENSPMLSSRGLGRVLGDLAALGYDAEWMCLSAAECGAPHQRERIWILAANANMQPGSAKQERQHQGAEKLTGCRKWKMGSPLAHPKGIGSQRQHASGCNGESGETGIQPEPSGGCGREDVADSMRQRQSGQGKRSDTGNIKADCERKAGHAFDGSQSREWPIEPDVGRVADGMAARTDRLKAIGNGQVPRVAATAFLELYRRITT